MNDMTESADTNPAPEYAPDELTTLKNRADLMGIKYHPNSKAKSLKAKIEAKLALTEPTDTIPDVAPITGELMPPTPEKKRTWLTHDEFLKETGRTTRLSLNRLVRVRVSCMNPNKREWEGEIISVGSAKLGTFKKFVPFNNEEGYHIPFIIYTAMKERQYTSYRTVKGPRGEKIRKGKLVDEFNIEVLDPLTPQEIKDLSQRQAASQAID